MGYFRHGLFAVAVVMSAGLLPLKAQEAKGTLEEQIMALPVWDTHNHLAGKHFKAQDFYELGHYFWFIRELNAAGYSPSPKPKKKGDKAPPDPLAEQERAEAFIKALDRSANTTWNHVFREGIKDLFDVDLEAPEDIFEINEKLKVTRDDPEWPSKVLDKIGVKRVSIQWRARNMENGLKEITDRHHYYVHFFTSKKEDLQRIKSATNAREEAEKVLQKKKEELDEAFANGVRVFRFPMKVKSSDEGDLMDKPDVLWNETSDWKINQYLAHSLLEYMNEKQVHLQLFFGVKNTMPKNNPNLMQEWAPLFKTYKGITFELFTASHRQAMDMVQVARNYRNVYPAGMWWLTYRRSQLLEHMQYRLEALPAMRSTFVASDARRVEWVYIKILMQKKVLVEFMEKQVADGWLTEEQAVETARWWLFDSVAELYEGKDVEPVQDGTKDDVPER